MRYFPRISQNSLKIPPKFRANTQIQSVTNAYIVIKTKWFLLYLVWNFIGFNLIYWNPICGKYFLDCSFLEKCGKIWKNGRFSGRLRPDWGKNAWAATAGLGSKGINPQSHPIWDWIGVPDGRNRCAIALTGDTDTWSWVLRYFNFL